MGCSVFDSKSKTKIVTKNNVCLNIRRRDYPSHYNAKAIEEVWSFEITIGNLKDIILSICTRLTTIEAILNNQLYTKMWMEMITLLNENKSRYVEALTVPE